MDKIKHHLGKIKNLNKDTQKLFLIILVVIFSLFFAFKFGILSPGAKLKGGGENEISEIKKLSSIVDQAKIYRKLIERVGPEQAQIDLFQSGLPFTGQTHLLNHTVGDYLYEKYGPAGLVQCKDFFLSSCYHGFILHAISDGGMPQVKKTFEYCLKAGPAVSSQCAHGIGHGFLANIGYKNLTKALQTCDEAIATIPGFPSFNCYDGVFMENIWAVHDGKPSPDRWVKESDILYPCDDKRIDDKYMLGCWSNQPSLAYQMFKGDVKKVAYDVCNKVENPSYKNMCFDGLSRQIHPLAHGSSVKTFQLCNLMPDMKWNNYCVLVNAGASYAVGDRDVPFEICANINEGAKADCYNRVFANMSAYKKPGENLKNLCTKVSDLDWRKKCGTFFN